MRIKPNDIKISSIFGESLFKIPKYQRAYEWGEQRRTDLFDDILKTDEHFFGSIICIVNTTPSEQDFTINPGVGYTIKYNEVIDGQQRLATISLLYLAILKKLIKLDKEENLSQARSPTRIRRIQNLEGKLLKYLFFENDFNGAKLVLSDINQSDITYKLILRTVFDLYNRIVSSDNQSEIIINDVEEYEEAHLNQIIIDAFNKYYKKIDDAYDINKLDHLENIITHLDNAILIKIDAEEANAFEIFESLNDRGQDLLPSDIIKNKFFIGMQKIQRSIFNLINTSESWDCFTRQLINPNNTYKQNLTIQKQFLKHYYLAFKYKSQIGTDHSTISDREIVRVYDKIVKKAVETTISAKRHAIEEARRQAVQTDNERIDEDRVNYRNYLSELLDDFTHNAHTYAVFLSSKAPQRQDFTTDAKFRIRKKMWELFSISAVPSYIILLYIFREYPDDLTTQEDVIDFLVKYFVRRHITNNPDPTAIENELVAVIKKCEETRAEHPELITATFIINLILEKIPPTDSETFKRILRRYDTFTPRSYVTRVVLVRFENSYYGINEPRIEYSNSKITIEHILPQAKNLNKFWVKMLISEDEEITDSVINDQVRRFADLSADDIQAARTIQLQNVYKLGNLTLTGFNSSLHKKEFSRKRDAVDDEDGITPTGFKNRFKLNRQLHNEINWRPQKIDNRTEFMAKKVFNIFRFSMEIEEVIVEPPDIP